MSANKIKIGIIGCGQIAQQHLTNYAKIPDAEVVALADIDPEPLNRSGEKFGVKNRYATAQEMLKRDDLDAVDVCLHNNFHVSGTVAALEAGFHVYCEKPMAGTYRDALTMLETARRLGKMLHIQLAFLYTDETRAAKALIDSGELGDLYHARSSGYRRRGRPYVDGYGKQPFVQKQFSGGGAMFDMGVYHISQLLYLMGNPKLSRVSGTTYQELPMDPERRDAAGYSVEELGIGLVRFEGGLTMDIIEAWAIQLGSLAGSCVVGTQGGVQLDPFSYHRTVADVDISSTVDLHMMRYRFNKLRGEEGVYASSQEHWIAALQGRVPLLNTAEIALNTALVSEGIYLSASRKQEVSVEEIVESSLSKALPL